MQKRKLGDIESSAIGYGCMGLSHAYGAALPKDEAIARIRFACEQGYTLFDTAEAYVGEYADGTAAVNEEVVGEALRPVRDAVVICTKGGIRWEGNRTVPDASRESIRRSCEASLKRLGVEAIDLYYMHRQDKTRAPEEVAQTFAELIAEGKIRHWGISNATADYIARADEVCKVSAVQIRYSMMARWTEELFPMLEERGIGAVAYSPIANGFLSGKVLHAEEYDPKTDFRSFMPQYQEEGAAKAAQLLELIEEIAREDDVTPAQISLTWVLARQPFIVPIPGTKSEERIVENAKAADIELTDGEMEHIDSLLSTLDLSVFGGT